MNTSPEYVFVVNLVNFTIRVSSRRKVLFKKSDMALADFGSSTPLAQDKTSLLTSWIYFKSWANYDFLRKNSTSIQGLLNVPFWVYWTSPYSSHLVDHIPIMESNGWVMWNMGTFNDPWHLLDLVTHSCCEKWLRIFVGFSRSIPVILDVLNRLSNHATYLHTHIYT